MGHCAAVQAGKLAARGRRCDGEAGRQAALSSEPGRQNTPAVSSRCGYGCAATLSTGL